MQTCMTAGRAHDGATETKREELDVQLDGEREKEMLRVSYLV